MKLLYLKKWLFPGIIMCICCVCPVNSRGDDDELFIKIWDGIQDTQLNYHSASGKIVETRTSKLLQKPLQFSGKFYVMNPDKFCMEYLNPAALKIIYNAGTVTIIFQREEPVTEVFDVAKNVARTKSYFSEKNSYKKLLKDFNVTAKEAASWFEIKMVSEKERFKNRINYVIIRLDKKTYLPQRLEIDGTNGINSVFEIEVVDINGKIDNSVFEYKQN